MKKQLTDAEKFFAGFSIVLGIALGVFVAPIFGLSLVKAGIIGSIAGSLFAYRIVRDPNHSHHKTSAIHKGTKHAQDDLFMSLVVKQLEKSYRIDHPKPSYPDMPDETMDDSDNEEDPITQEELEGINNKLAIELNIQKEKRKIQDSEIKRIVLNLDEETAEMDTDDEIDEWDETIEEREEDEYTEESDFSEDEIPSNVFSSKFSNVEEDRHWLTLIILSPHTPLILAALWIIAALTSLNYFPQLSEFILRFVSGGNIVILPAFFLIGISGFLEIFQSRPKEELTDLDTKSRIPLLGALKIIFGWGFLIFIAILNN